MLNDELECAPLFEMFFLHAAIEKHSCQVMFIQALPLIGATRGFKGIVTSSVMMEFSLTSTKTKMVPE
jgi:hypothetical protein